jgi:hypothetical protein
MEMINDRSMISTFFENNLLLIHTGVHFSSEMVNDFLTYVCFALYYC